MKEIFKKYAFVFIVGIFFVIVVAGYGITTITSGTPTKTVDGKQIVYSIAGLDKSADDVFDYYYGQIGENVLLNAFTNAVIDNYEPTTNEMKETAKQNANNLILYYQQSYGSSYETYILDALRGMGYSTIDDLDDYYIRMEKYNNLVNNYLLANPTSEMTDYQDKQGRVVSHILVQMVDPDNPTEAEMEKVEQIETALANGEDFANVAAQYSDDTSASNGGSLGAMNNETAFVQEFLDAALALNPNEVTTDWVKTEYGWHLIKCDSTDMTDILNGGLRDEIIQADGSLVYVAVWQQAQQLGVTYADDNTKALIEDVFSQYVTVDETTSEEAVETETPVETEAPVETDVPVETEAPVETASAQ